MASQFRLLDDSLLEPVLQSFPGREHQIRALATLLHPSAAPCRNLVLHGTEATGKSAVTEHLLARLAADTTPSEEEQQEADSNTSLLNYAIVNAAQCITGRHLFERIVGAVADALRHNGAERRCETLAQLAVAMTGMLRDAKKADQRDQRWRFVLVLDAIDRQRDAPPTLLPALARLSEIIPSLTCVFIVTAPPAGFLRTPASAHLHFPPYAKPEFVRILALSPPAPVAGSSQRETSELWARFCAAVHDALVRSASRSLPAFRRSCVALWPRFVAPVVARTHSVKEFSKLLVAARAHFQDESLLNPSIVSVRPGAGAANASQPPQQPQKGVSTPVFVNGKTTPSSGAAAIASPELVGLLPVVARLLLLAAYLASHNATRHDLTLFSTYHHGRKRRRGGGFVAGAQARGTPKGARHRKIARKLLGAHAFVLERMLAIFEAVRGEWAPEGSSVGVAGLDGDVGMAIATLASLRLLVRVGSGDVTDRAGKWRINASWEAVRGIGRSIGVEVEEWLIG